MFPVLTSICALKSQNFTLLFKGKDEIWALLGYYAAYSDNFLTLEYGTDRLSRNVGKESSYTQLNIAEERRFHLQFGGSPKSRQRNDVLTAQPCLYASSIKTNSRTLNWWLTRWSIVISEKSTVPQLRKKFHAFQWTQRFITMFTTWTRSFQSTISNPHSLRFNLILSFYLCLGFPIGFFHSGFHTKTLYEFLFFLVRVTCRTHQPVFFLSCDRPFLTPM